MMEHPLPSTVQAIADVVGREKALALAGSYRGSVYIPKKLKPNHPLLAILGEDAAKALVKEYGGILLYVAKCSAMKAAWRDKAIREWDAKGMPHLALAQLTGLTQRHINNVLGEIPPQDRSKFENQGVPSRFSH